MGRSPSGWWFARALAMQRALDGGRALSDVAGAEGLTPPNARRLLSVAAHAQRAAAAHAVPEREIRPHLHAWEAFQSLERYDAGAAGPLTVSALRGEVPASWLQSRAREARARASVPPGVADLSVDAILEAFGRPGRWEDADGRKLATITAEPGPLGLVAESSFQAPENVVYEWALLLSPAFRRSPLHGAPFAEFWVRLAAVLLVYEHVYVACASAYEVEQARAFAREYNYPLQRCTIAAVEGRPPGSAPPAGTIP